MSDMVLRGGHLIDGGGQPMKKADLLVENGVIKEIGAIGRVPGARELDCAGAWICPGFIDPHRHIDAAILKTPGYGEVELRQGVTTAIGGNCGLSLAPCAGEYAREQRAYLKPVLGSCDELPVFDRFSSYLEAVEKSRPSVNAGFFVGDGTVRMNAFGFAAPEKFPPDRLAASVAGIREALEAGAFGLTMGLMYVPEASYRFEELAACVRVAAEFDVPVMAHMRGEGETLPASVREIVALIRATGARMGISHFKAAGPVSWGAPFEEALNELKTAREAGLSLYADAYPYEAGSTTLLSLLPPDWQRDGLAALKKRLGEPAERALLKRILSVSHTDWDNQLSNPGWEDTILISAAGSEQNRPYIGLYVGEIAKRMGAEPIDAVAEMLSAEPDGISIISFSMDPKNVRRVYSLPDTMVISDSVLPDGPKHPRYAGSFARFFSKYARGDEALFSPEEAIRRMTGLTASVYGLKNKGLLREGYDADITVIEPDTYRDRATYTAPGLLAQGVRWVLVNGEIAVRSDEKTDGSFGRTLRRK